MRLRLLGPLAVFDGADPVPIGRPKQRLLLAVLATRAGRTLSTAELVEALWPHEPPASAVANIRAYVHGLRRTLGAGAVTGRGRPGYALSIPAEDIDAVRFSRLAGRGAAALADGAADAARALLHRALGLWQGAAFEDLADAPAVGAYAAELEEQRLAALENRIEADLRAGGAGDLVVELRRLVGQHPYRERFHAHLMVALERGGRQADALAAYRAARATLSRDLGIEPGPELRRLESAILRGERAAPEVRTPPGELPPAGRFAGRTAELDRLDALAAAIGRTGTAPVVAVVGSGGVGKTALAVRWAHRAADRFPDGQIFLDLRGFHPAGPAAPEEVLARVLRSLGVAPDRVPARPDEAAALYRSLLSHRRVLVLLDNASSAEQVRPLLPAGAGCLALVTSRNSLPGLAAREGAEVLTLRPMPVPEGVAVLAAVLGPEQVRAERPATAELVEACGGLPLALRIAAANLAGQAARPIASYVAELRGGHRLDRLANDGDEHRSVRATFDLSYAALEGGVRRLFALTGLVPGPDLTVDAAAALAGRPPAETARHLDRLAGAHLLQRPAPGRWAPHDLAREYARDRAAAEESVDCEAALGGLLRHYRQRADAAARVLYPQLLRLETKEPAETKEPEEPSPDPGDALDWLGSELANLVAAAVYAAEHGPHREAWLIADALRGYCFYQVKLAEWGAVAAAGAAAAARAGDPRAMAAGAMNRGHCRHVAGDYGAALSHFAEALDLSRRSGWPESEAAVLANIAATYGELGDIDRTVHHLRAALAINRRTGWRPGQIVTLGNLGIALMWLGRLAEAESHLRAARALCQADGAAGAQAALLAQLVEALTLAGRHGEARAFVAEGIELARAAGRLTAEAHLLVRRSILSCHEGEPAAARDDAARALKLVGSTGDRLLTSAVHSAYGRACAGLGRTAEALSHHRAAIRLSHEIHGRSVAAEALVAYAEAARRVQPRAACAAALEALAAARAGGYLVVEGMAHAVLAALERDRGRRAAGAEHARWARRISAQTGWRLTPDAVRALRTRRGAGVPVRRTSRQLRRRAR